ncbi:MAG: hypothetical protein ABIO70_04640 [Pseudomonadota bacterium]
MPHALAPGGGFAWMMVRFLMDVGNGAALVARDTRKARILVLPIVGRWLERAWGWYWKLSKLKKVPRIPGM